TKSLEYAKLSVQYDSANISAKNNLAISYWKIGDAGKAVEILKNVIDVNPAHSNAYSNLAAIYKSSGDNLNAGKMYVLAIHYNPNDIKTLENYAKLLLVEKKYVELDEIVCSILKLNPLNNFALENKGFSVKMKDSILNKEYENFFSEGVLFFNKNDFKQALKCFRKSLNLNPDLDECRKYAAECYLKLGDKKKYDIEINRK
ncbi:MAG TPA: tetratricopeptide repeat protein, partial [bacterium]|nr:tetratricopeptide repeat protein [bacterium]